MRFPFASAFAPLLAALAITGLAASCGGGDSSSEPHGSGSATSGGSTSASSAGAGGASASSGATTTSSASGEVGGAGGTGAATTATSSATGSGGAGGQGTGGAGGMDCECPPPPECTDGHCEGLDCVFTNSPIGAVCSIGQCNGQGQCVECLVGADCPSLVCLNNTCAAPSCADMTQNGAETAVDCGGPVCPPCADGQGCQSGADCQSGVCLGGLCVMATCNDGAQNGAETGTDCGGPSCPDCPVGGGCQSGADCQSGVCMAGLCVMATCNDGAQNGTETGTDCGGPSCPDCPTGGGCQSGADCQSGVCVGGLCIAATCNDGVKNGAETGTDCGGPSCPDCPTGGGCQSGADCQSGVCLGGLCIAPACNDGVKNGAETAVDCGGALCPQCANGLGCLVSGDCVSGNCQSGLCAASGYACLGQAPDAVTGQGCPIFTPCTQFADCGVFQGCNQWFCNNTSQCELNTLSNCGTTVGGGCAAEVVFTQHDDPPTDKRFVPPDGVNFREVGTLTFTITNNTATDLYLDKIPMTLETQGGGSQFEVTSAKLYDDSGGTDYSIGDLFICLTGNPFQFPANGVLGPCAGSSFTKVPKNGGSNRFVVTLAFGADKTYIAGRSYRAKITSTAGFAFKVGFNGPPFVGTMCGIPAGGYAGAWVTAQSP